MTEAEQRNLKRVATKDWEKAGYVNAPTPVQNTVKAQAKV